MRIEPHGLFEIYKDKRKLYTLNCYPQIKERFAERTVKNYREFSPDRSKLAAAIAKGSPNIGFRKGDVVLYLGSSHGYTCSFVSDIVGQEGLIFAVDLAPRVMRDLVYLAEDRKNIIPILADANQLDQLKDKICQADIIFQDIAQKNQTDIFIRNCDLFLKDGGYGLISVKARSIDVRLDPNIIFKDVRETLEKKFTVIDFRKLQPYEKDHCLIIVKK
jgi:fibrillarin-like pre-rRNA processing protein